MIKIPKFTTILNTASLILIVFLILIFAGGWIIHKYFPGYTKEACVTETRFYTGIDFDRGGFLIEHKYSKIPIFLKSNSVYYQIPVEEKFIILITWHWKEGFIKEEIVTDLNDCYGLPTHFK